MMSNINNLIAFLVLALAGFALGGDIVANDHIKVFLFGAAAFYSEVAVDVRNDTCLSLNNNLIDGSANSVLVGGHDVWAVLSRDDDWYCIFYDNYDCNGTEDTMLLIPGGANNLESSGWGARVHGIRCINDD